jgi:hypothetical protein
MTSFSIDPVRRLRVLLVLLFVMDLVLGAAYGINYAAGAPWGWFTRNVDLDGEGNAATWYAATLWLLAGILFLLAVLPRLDRRRISTFLLLLMPAVCLYCSLDETAQLHEGMANHLDQWFLRAGRAGTVLSHTGVWVFVLAPVAALLAGSAIRMLRREFGLGHPGLWLSAVAWAGFLFSAAGAELVSNLTWKLAGPNMVEVLIEETGENLSVTLLCWAAVDLLAASGFRVAWTVPDREANDDPG